MKVSLQEISAETVREVTRSSVKDEQKNFVASNAVSLAQALFSPEAWYRAIYYGNELAGFVMLYDESLRATLPKDPKVIIWRFMIDEKFQGKGIGKAALQLVLDHIKAKGIFTSVKLSYVPEPGCPEPFYRALGFQPTGEIEEGEIVLELKLL